MNKKVRISLKFKSLFDVHFWGICLFSFSLVCSWSLLFSWSRFLFFLGNWLGFWCNSIIDLIYNNIRLNLDSIFQEIIFTFDKPWILALTSSIVMTGSLKVCNDFWALSALFNQIRRRSISSARGFLSSLEIWAYFSSYNN